MKISSMSVNQRDCHTTKNIPWLIALLEKILHDFAQRPKDEQSSLITNVRPLYIMHILQKSPAIDSQNYENHDIEIVHKKVPIYRNVFR